MTGARGAIVTAAAGASARSHNLHAGTDPDVTLELRYPTTRRGPARSGDPSSGGRSAAGAAA